MPTPSPQEAYKYQREVQTDATGKVASWLGTSRGYGLAVHKAPWDSMHGRDRSDLCYRRTTW